MQNRNRLTDIENKLVVTSGEREDGWGTLEVCKPGGVGGTKYWV